MSQQDREASAPEPEDREPSRAESRATAARRMAQQHTWVDLQIRQAMDRGDFDDLPGAGKPLRDLGTEHDPDWWLKQLVERERITVLPESVQLRRLDAELDARLDTTAVESEVRREVEEFNARVIRARYSLAEGPPLVTMPRDVEDTVAAWRARREARRTRSSSEAPASTPRRRWWRRGGRSRR